MPTYANAIDQVQNVIKKLRTKLPQHYAKSHIVFTPVISPINQIFPENLVTVLAKECLVDINIMNLDGHSEDIGAYRFVTEDDKYLIRVVKDNTCWTRYLICKELSHLFLYSDDSVSVTPRDLEDLFSGLLNEDIDNADLDSVEAEKLAYYVAFEMLIPSDIVPDLLAIRQKLFQTQSAEHPNLRLAKKLLVPEKVVEFRLDKDDLFQSFYNDSKQRIKDF
jgi:Zn-dependent peptidase ImmA (M78 family)